jgi:hypothetical protein
MYFSTKSYLKSIHNHTVKQARNAKVLLSMRCVCFRAKNLQRQPTAQTQKEFHSTKI